MDLYCAIQCRHCAHFLLMFQPTEAFGRHCSLSKEISDGDKHQVVKPGPLCTIQVNLVPAVGRPLKLGKKLTETYKGTACYATLLV